MASIQVTTREAAAAHRVSLRTAQRWAASGKLNAAKNEAGRWVITLNANLADFKPAAIDKARELIESGGILPTSRPGIYTAVSSDGAVTYLVHRCGCSCPAGARGKHLCYHRAAAAILAAAVPAHRAA
ncbi:helix-turn-helix domain-containing protein [Streptosporangium sp. NPDC049078]|uniref:helix-turn-helix domain-containing protein n=1 Tax=Streptosporangium sp. NPDC049078 TaxID=3155767 RepID=UPI003420364D